MSPKTVIQLSADEMRKECVKLGLSGRMTMKEALVNLTATLVKKGKDPQTYLFFPSQPLIGYFSNDVVVMTDIVETMRVLPSSTSTLSRPSMSTTTSSLTTSIASTGVSSSASAQVPLCSNIPFFNPHSPPPMSKPILSENRNKASSPDVHVLEKILNSVDKIHNILERAKVFSDKEIHQSDSEFESFSSVISSSSKMLSQSEESYTQSEGSFTQSEGSFSSCQDYPGQRTSLPSSTSSFGQSGFSIPSTSFSSGSSNRSSNQWSKQVLIEESICIRFQHGSCKYVDDHPGNSHLCAKCYLSYDELLESGHGADFCPLYPKSGFSTPSSSFSSRSSNWSSKNQWSRKVFSLS